MRPIKKLTLTLLLFIIQFTIGILFLLMQAQLVQAQQQCCTSPQGRPGTRYCSGSNCTICEECARGQSCDRGICFWPYINECTDGAKTCTNGDAYVCVSGSWSISDRCGTDEKCENGSCVPDHQCTTVGYTRCVSATVKETCTLVSGVRKWVPTTCACGCSNSTCNLCDQCQAGQLRCDGNWLQNCNTVANPNVWNNYFYCSYGCTGSECVAAPATPYCINAGCCEKDGNSSTDEQFIQCWNSYKSYTDKDPFAYDDCINTTCLTQQCHPTVGYCIGNNVSPCPISAYPTRTEKWLDNCGGIDCRVPVSGSCGSSNPIPPIPPPPETPTCTITGISANPTSYLPGVSNTYTASLTTTNFSPANTVDEVSFRVYNAANELIAGPTIDTAPNPYSFSFSPQTSGTFKIIATGSIYRTGFIPCTRELTINVPRRTTTLNVEGYSTPPGSCIPTLIPLTALLTRITAPSASLGPASTFSVQTGNDLTYRIAANTPAGSSYNASICSSPIPNEGNFVAPVGTAEIRQFQLPYINPSNRYIFRFFYTFHANAWFQITNGDVGSKTGSISQEIPYAQTMLTPTTGDSSGVGIAGIDLNITGQGSYAPNSRFWKAEGTGLAKTEDWFTYFKRTYEIVQQTSSSFSSAFPVGGNYNLVPTDLGNPNNMIENRITESYNEYLYYHDGNLTITDAIPIGPNVKHTIFVAGNLTVNSSNITVPQGSFLAFIVQGNIIFNAPTRNIEGVYIANQNLTIADADSDIGMNRQFRGSGLFIASGAVSLERDLDPDQNNLSYPNNLSPSELFTYRPDFVANAPRGLKRIPIKWREIEPQPLPQ